MKINEWILRFSLTIITLTIVSWILTWLFYDLNKFTSGLALFLGFFLSFVIFVYYSFKVKSKYPANEFTLQLVIGISFLLCIAIILYYHWFTNETSELDMVSHFFGGITTTAITFLLIETKTLPFLKGYEFHSLVIVVVFFELFEYLFLVYFFPQLKSIPTVTQPFDTITDIMAGLGGGSFFIWWYKQHKERPCTGS